MPTPPDLSPPGRRAPDAPYTDDEREAVRSRHAGGMGRNQISRETGIHTRKVSKIAEELGLTFKRAAWVREAVDAKRVDAKARRAALQLALLGDAERMREQLWSACVVYNFGGKDNTYEEHPLTEPSFRDKREIMTAVGIAVDRAVKLDQYDADPGVDAAKSMLGALAAGLGAAYDQLTAPPTDGD